MKQLNNIAAFVKYNREKLNLTQEQLADMSGVGIHFIRDLEQGKPSRFDKADKVLQVFGFHLAPTVNSNDPWGIWLKYLNKPVTITKKNKQEVVGWLMEEVRDETGVIIAWKIVPNLKAMEWQRTKDKSLYVEVKQNDIEKIHEQLV
ncbi:MAG: helix-turn-helix transcriptional regulator [Bacteroidia bacterium]|nr:helix-turn-helix transcriptional regulator [Bacteroidia bacterium]